MEFSEKLRILRKRLGVSPEKLAMMCVSENDNSTISGNYIRRLESGNVKSPTLETARVLARGLGVAVSALIDTEVLQEDAIKDYDLANFFRTGLIPALGNIQLSKLTRERIQSYYNEKVKTVKAQTVVHHHTCLHKALETAIEWKLLTYNPADKAKPAPPELVEMLFWGEDETVKFLEASKPTPYYVCFYTELYSGMRRSEILALRWCDIDFDTARVNIWRSVHRKKGGGIYFRTVKKKKSKRNIVLTRTNIKLLRDYKLVKEAEAITLTLPFTEEDRVFDFYPDSLSRAWVNIEKKAGVKRIRLHDGRHSHASLLFKKNVHPKIVQERLGHASVQITLDTYSHMLPGMQEEAIEDIDLR